MSDHFVRMVFSEKQNDDMIKTFAGAVAHTIDRHLKEDEGHIMFESYETTEGHYVYEVALNQELDDVTAEEMANTIASAIPGDYDIEVSGGDDSSR